MDEKQRAALEQAAHEKAINEAGYLPSKKPEDLNRREAVVYRKAKRCVLFGAEWMERNMWVPVTERLPEERGQYEVTTFLRSGGRIVETWGFDPEGEEEYIEEWRDRVVAWKFPTAPYTPPKA